MNIEACIQKLTLEEKAALLQGKSNWRTHSIPRLGIPDIFLSDGPHGLRKQANQEDNVGLHPSEPATCFPTAAAMANSWDVALGRELGAALGAEAVASDVHVVLGPGLNIKRSPLCGRNFEYFSEDPYLAGKMAAAYIRGIQNTGAAACPKHFAANSQELRRMSSDSILDERTLREIYLTGFEIAVKEAAPKSIMSSYNRINGVYANENPHLLQEILRKEWGFDGFVVSDWGASNDHAEGVRCGSNLEMPNPGADSAITLVNAVRSGQLPESALDDRLRELLKVVFDVSEAVADAPKNGDYEAHHALAAKCAAESIVLLENDGILPLTAQKVALIGEFAEKPRYQGAGSSRVNPTKLSCLKAALAQKLPGLTYAPGGQEAVRIAREADVVLLCIGLDDVAESEGMDRSTLALPQSHLALFEAVSKVNPNVVLVLSGGSPFQLPETGFRGAIHGYLGGQAGVEAMADALLGRVNPSGHLAESWPYALEDTPCHRYYPAEGMYAQYREGLFVGYRYYDTAGVPVRYPFGYGLSYTKFAYSDLEANKNGVRFTLTNTGSRDGAEVAQLYVACRGGRVIRPKKELKGFQKVFLKAGESRRVEIPLDDKAFRYFNTETGRFEVETANYELMVASDVSHVELSATIRIMGTEAPIPEAELPSYRTGKVTDVTDEEFARLLGRAVPVEQPGEDITLLDTVSAFHRSKGAVTRWLASLVAKDIEKSRQKGDPAPDSLFAYNLPVRGLGQMTGGIITRKMTRDILQIANGHFFKGTAGLVKHFFAGRKEAREFWQKVREPQK